MPVSARRPRPLSPRRRLPCPCFRWVGASGTADERTEPCAGTCSHAPAATSPPPRSHERGRVGEASTRSREIERFPPVRAARGGCCGCPLLSRARARGAGASVTDARWRAPAGSMHGNGNVVGGDRSMDSRSAAAPGRADVLSS